MSSSSAMLTPSRLLSAERGRTLPHYDLLGVERVNHAFSPEQLLAVGRGMECQALARAVSYHVERRVFLNGARTVVLS